MRGNNRRKLSLSWTSVLMENLILCLMSDVNNVAGVEWSDSKDKIMLDGDDPYGEWRMMEPNVGPFEPPNVDYRNWIKYVRSRNEIVRKRIRDIENGLLLTGLTNIDSLSEETHRKIPEGDNNKGEESTSETPLMKTIRDGFPAIKHHLELLRNWSAYLEDITFNEETPLETIHEVMTALERNFDYSEVTRLNRLIGEGMTRGERPGKERLRGGDGDILREMRRKLSETFLYRNITLADIKRMSRIVDFVERYHGKLGARRSDGNV